MEKVDRIAHFLSHIAGGDDYLDDVDAICTRITELERERDETRAEVERLRRALIDARLMSGRKMPTSDEEDKTDKAELAALREENKRLTDALAELSEAAREVLKHAVILSEKYLSVFDTWPDTATIQGWEKSRWKSAIKAKKRIIHALAQARAEREKEATLARVDEIEEAYHSADDSKLVFKEVKP